MTTPRIFLPRRWSEGETIALPKAESRHVQVLRLQPGDGVVLFNGEDDCEWTAEIAHIGRAEVQLRVGAASPQPGRELPFAVTLAIGIPANERMDALVEKATELGAAAIQPLVCERSVVRLAGERAEARQRHWAAVAASASEQCGRVRVPTVGVPTRLGGWLRALDAAQDTAPRWILSLAASAQPAVERMRQRPDGHASGLIVLSGPEGGLSPDEEASALRESFLPVSLGPRTLRADTAPLALLAWLGLAERGQGA
jgi:16S rRNA (uracil1498-N3)-methyltransferase